MTKVWDDNVTPTVLNVTREQWDKFVDACENPKPPNEELKALMRGTSPWADKSLSDFTRVCEERGILNQKEAPLTKPGSEHD